MTQEAKGKQFFIVDNSDSGWTGLRYLEEWTPVRNHFFQSGPLPGLESEKGKIGEAHW